MTTPKLQIGSNFQFQMTSPYPSPLPTGERVGVRGFGFWVIEIYLGFGACDLVLIHRVNNQVSLHLESRFKWKRLF